MGPPVSHGGVVGKDLQAEIPIHVALNGPDVGRRSGCLLIGGGLLLASGVLFGLRRFLLLRGRGGSTVLGGRRGLLGGLPRILVPFQLRLSADHGAGFRSESLRLGKEPAEQIIARNSNCGDAEEQDYVEALALHEIAQLVLSRFLFHKETLHALYVNSRSLSLWKGCLRSLFLTAGGILIRFFQKFVSPRTAAEGGPFSLASPLHAG